MAIDVEDVGNNCKRYTITDNSITESNISDLDIWLQGDNIVYIKPGSIVFIEGKALVTICCKEEHDYGNLTEDTFQIKVVKKNAQHLPPDELVVHTVKQTCPRQAS